VTETNIMTEK